MAGGGGLNHRPATELRRYVGFKGTLRRVLTRSVLACGCAPHAASAPALDPDYTRWETRSHHIVFERQPSTQSRHSEICATTGRYLSETAIEPAQSLAVGAGFQPSITVVGTTCSKLRALREQENRRR